MKNFAAIDFETANAKRTSVCSVGIVVVENGEITNRYYSLVKPVPNMYHWGCSKVNGLSKKDTNDARTFPEVWKEIIPLIKDFPLIAHNKSFDESCLKECFKVHRMRYPKYVFHCTEQESRKIFLDLENYKLKTVSAYCGYDLQNHHHALADAEACASIGIKIFCHEKN